MSGRKKSPKPGLGLGLFHYPSSTRARLLIPDRYPKPDLLPAGYPTRENLLYFWLFLAKIPNILAIFRNFWLFSAKFFKFLAFFCRNFWLFPPKFRNFLPVFRQNPETFVKINATYYPTGTRVPDTKYPGGYQC